MCSASTCSDEQRSSHTQWRTDKNNNRLSISPKLLPFQKCFHAKDRPINWLQLKHHILSHRSFQIRDSAISFIIDVVRTKASIFPHKAHNRWHSNLRYMYLILSQGICIFYMMIKIYCQIEGRKIIWEIAAGQITGQVSRFCWSSVWNTCQITVLKNDMKIQFCHKTVRFTVLQDYLPWPITSRNVKEIATTV